MKKSFSKFTNILAMLLILSFFVGTLSAATVASINKRCDIDGSGEVDAADAVYLLYSSVFGEDAYPTESDGDMDGNGRVDSRDAVYLLYNIVFGEDYYPIPDESGAIPITLNDRGISTTYDFVPGDKLPVPDAYVSNGLTRHEFLGWYDKTLTNVYTVAPDSTTALYAVYEGCDWYDFDNGGFFDPNNRGLNSVVNDPFGGQGKVLYSKIINLNDNVYYGFYRGLAPSSNGFTSGEGYKIKKNHTYNITFKYHFGASDPQNAVCTVTAWGADRAGIHLNGHKTSMSVSSDLKNPGNQWGTVSFNITNTTDNEYLYLRFMGGSSSVTYDFYVDDLVIVDTTKVEDSDIKLVNGGIVTKPSLKVGDPLPVLDGIKDDLTNSTFAFDGWYDETLTTKYTTVSSTVKTYYARYKDYTAYSFNLGGMYDPNNRYSATSSGIAAWYRAPDPTGADNICMRADLNGNSNNTHFALSLFEGSAEGFKLNADLKYVISFRYYLKSNETDTGSFSVRGSNLAGIGTSGGKTGGIGSFTMDVANNWHTAFMLVSPQDEDVVNSPYLIVLSQGDSKIKDNTVYIDDLVVKEYTYSLVIKTPAENITYNDHGSLSTMNDSFIGADLSAPKDYYGANFVGWYNETLTVPVATVPKSGATLYAKHDGSIITFENGGYFDPNGNAGKEGAARYSIINDPTDPSNKVLKYDLVENGNNVHFAPSKSSYDATDGFKLTKGNKYTVSFMYYAENLNGTPVSFQFRGCKTANIGTIGGKSSAYGTGKVADIEGAWTGITVSFTYNGDGIEEENNPYLIMLAQQSTDSEKCTATLYIDNVVIKETEAAKTYQKKSVKVNGWTIGFKDATNDRPHYIVVPDYNFSYLAMMQCEELAAALKAGTTSSKTFKIVKESAWTQADNQFNIFIGDVKGHSRDNAEHKIDTSGFTKDDYAISFGGGNVYIDGGSTYALAMGISEFGKIYENAADGSTLSGVVKGKYSEKINSYSTKTYYRPTFLEDFEGTEIDTTKWEVVNGSTITAALEGWSSKRSAEHTYLKDGNLVIEAAYSEEKKMFYGGMLRSHGKMEYRYGYLETSCITPHGKGLWTAMWTTQHGASSGLMGSEVDINESFGDSRYTAFNMHSWPTSAGVNFGKTHYSLDGRSGASAKKADAGEGKTFNSEFHTFGYLWTETRHVFTVDGKVQYEYNVKPSSSYYKNDVDAFNEKLSLIVSMTVANPQTGGQEPTLGADYWKTTNKYIVDYVHIYQIDGQEMYNTPPAN